MDEIQTRDIIKKAREIFYVMVDNFGSDPYGLLSHVPEMEKWAHFMLRRYPNADAEVVLLAVWLHDIGHYPVPTEEDHAVRGEIRARDFFEKENYATDRMHAVLHCVRAHRCRDVMPETVEAKVVAFIDSASHMTDAMYFNMMKEDKEKNAQFRVYAKMERDYRDLGFFPEMQEELRGMHDAWKNLLQEYEKIDV
ncbi:MAG: HD domain-containing protein [Parcubacteria group bacterium]|jgi:23S rRNA maturation-related 3'-5' exoribonuclease YhaM